MRSEMRPRLIAFDDADVMLAWGQKQLYVALALPVLRLPALYPPHIMTHLRWPHVPMIQAEMDL